MNTPFVLQRSQVIGELVMHLNPRVHVRAWDRDYNVGSPQAYEALARQLRKELFESGLIDWTPENDCDNFAVEAWRLARKNHAQAVRQKMPGATAEGIAFGLLEVPLDGDPDQNHAMNIVRLKDGWVAWEPQLPGFRQLTTAERAAAYFVLI